MFDRIVCISLKRRPDRREAFRSRLPVDWPWRPVEIIDAIDGTLCKHPQWWKQGGGAWGCYRSHLGVIESAINDGAGSILILEDDVTFVEGFSVKAQEYLCRLPTDWGQAYFGGQHLKRPERVCDGVMRAMNINRTHAYALRGIANMQECYRWLCNTENWPPRNHVDHHYGRMHEARIIPAYTPSDWLCGQSADAKSDVCWKEMKERWWHMKKPPLATASEPPFVAVIGLHRSGSSCIAMMLHKLGVSMGNKIRGYEAKNGGGGEAVGLSAICEKAARFPATAIRNPAKCQTALSRWIAGRRRAARGICGGKYPHLCAMGDMLREAAGAGLLVVHCDRPLEESVESLKRRSRKSRGWLAVSDEDSERVQAWLWAEKQKFLSATPPHQVLNVQYARLRKDPAAIVAEMVEFLGIRPTEEQVAAAVAHVKQEGEK